MSIFRSTNEEDSANTPEDPFRKIISHDFNGKVVKFDSNDMPMEKCDQINELYAVERAKLHNPALAKHPRLENETFEDYKKRVGESSPEGSKPDDPTFRKEGESEEDWYKRIFSNFKADLSAFSLGLKIINGAQKIIYGDKAVELTEDEYKKLPSRKMMKFVLELLQEAGIKSAPEFDPDPKSVSQE